MTDDLEYFIRAHSSIEDNNIKEWYELFLTKRSMCCCYSLSDIADRIVEHFNNDRLKNTEYRFIRIYSGASGPDSPEHSSIDFEADKAGIFVTEGGDPYGLISRTLSTQELKELYVLLNAKLPKNGATL